MESGQQCDSAQADVNLSAIADMVNADIRLDIIASADGGDVPSDHEEV